MRRYASSLVITPMTGTNVNYDENTFKVHTINFVFKVYTHARLRMCIIGEYSKI